MDETIGVLISESTATEVEFKVTEEHRNGFLVAEGILQEANEVNRNKRFYPLEELQRAIISPRVQELVKSGNLKGEAGHPTDTSLARQTKIDPTLEQVWYLKLWMDGPFVKGRFRGTNNELGRSFNEDLRCGQKPSFSLRAVGALSNENGRLTVRKMQMITYDRVYFPSHSKAYTSKIVTTENSSFQKVDNKLYDVSESSYFYDKIGEINAISESGNLVDVESDIVTPLTSSEIKDYIITESSNIHSVLNTFDILYESVSYDAGRNMVNMKTKYGDRVSVCLEQAIQKDLIANIGNKFFEY